MGLLRQPVQFILQFQYHLPVLTHASLIDPLLDGFQAQLCVSTSPPACVLYPVPTHATITKGFQSFHPPQAQNSEDVESNTTHVPIQAHDSVNMPAKSSEHVSL